MENEDKPVSLNFQLRMEGETAEAFLKELRRYDMKSQAEMARILIRKALGLME